MILPGVELKIFDLGVGELPPGLTPNRGGKMTKISSWGGKSFFFHWRVLGLVHVWCTLRKKQNFVATILLQKFRQTNFFY